MGFLLPSDIGLPLIPLIAGFSTAKALRSEGIPAMVRWPNDIWLGQGKLGGMLCDSVKRSAESVFFVAGIGINLMAGEEKTPDAPYGRAYAGRSGDSPSELRTRLLGAIARQVISNVRAYVRTGIVPDRSLWPELDILKGREIILDNNAGSILRGRAAGIAESGALLIESEGEVRPCVSGTVRLPDEWGKGKGK